MQAQFPFPKAGLLALGHRVSKGLASVVAQDPNERSDLPNASDYLERSAVAYGNSKGRRGWSKVKIERQLRKREQLKRWVAHLEVGLPESHQRAVDGRLDQVLSLLRPSTTLPTAERSRANATRALNHRRLLKAYAWTNRTLDSLNATTESGAGIRRGAEDELLDAHLMRAQIAIRLLRNPFRQRAARSYYFEQARESLAHALRVEPNHDKAVAARLQLVASDCRRSRTSDLIWAAQRLTEQPHTQASDRMLWRTAKELTKRRCEPETRDAFLFLGNVSYEKAGKSRSWYSIAAGLLRLAVRAGARGFTTLARLAFSAQASSSGSVKLYRDALAATETPKLQAWAKHGEATIWHEAAKRSYHKMHEYKKKALQSYDRALELDPDNNTFLENQRRASKLRQHHWVSSRTTFTPLGEQGVLPQTAYDDHYDVIGELPVKIPAE